VAVWTGSEMIVWGGGPIDANGNFSVALADGAAYEPRSDTWRSIHLAPGGLIAGAAVWTGTQMIVWGGSDSQGPTTRGYAYDPATDAWSTLTEDGAPAARVDFAAVWTGQSLVIWGGNEDDTSIPFTPNDGATWFPMASPGIGDGGFGVGD
ncbi:MAG TPA: hypothetical protein VK841_08705, partial [Polyangiaceae bacterium]|nr:hypothetical protein [Polyangiaceae bacterium]